MTRPMSAVISWGRATALSSGAAAPVDPVATAAPALPAQRPDTAPATPVPPAADGTASDPAVPGGVRVRIRRRVAIVIAVIVLLAAIHLSYQFIVAPAYTYMKLSYASPEPFLYAVLLILALAMSLIMPVTMSRPGDFILWALYVLVVIPSLTISYLARTLSDGMQLMLAFVVTACFSAVILAARLPADRFAQRLRPLGVRAFWVLIAAISAVTYLSLAASGSLSLSLPGLGEVYSVRSAFSSANAANRVLAYAMPNQANVINPLLLAVGIISRRKWLVVAAVVGELLLYGAAGHKSVLFAVPALLVVAWVFRGGRRPSGSLVAWGFSGVIVVSAIADEILQTPWLSSLFTRRFIDVPGLLTGAWVNVFSEGPKAHFAYGFLSPFLTYPYPVAPPFVVAHQYFGIADMNANANFVADGYANGGWAGVVFESAILAAIIVLANALGRRVPLHASVMLLVMPVVALSNASVLTSLLTHGVVLALLILAFAPTALWDRQPARVATAPSAESVAGHGAWAVSSGSPSWWQRRKRQLLRDSVAEQDGS